MYLWQVSAQVRILLTSADYMGYKAPPTADSSHLTDEDEAGNHPFGLGGTSQLAMPSTCHKTIQTIVALTEISSHNQISLVMPVPGIFKPSSVALICLLLIV
jgi:hypothetical protein